MYLNGATKPFTAQPRFKGGAAFRTLTGNVTCDKRTETFCFWDPGGASRDVTLPAEAESDGLFLFFSNEADAAENLVLKDDGGSTISTLNQGEWGFVACDGTTWRDMPFSALSDYLASSNAWTGTQTFQNVILGAASELTIATGAVAATRSYHTLDTEADAASDDLDSITGGAAGELLLVRPENGARTVVLKHALGANLIATPGGRPIYMADATDWALLVHNGTQWTVIAASGLAEQVHCAASFVSCAAESSQARDVVIQVVDANGVALARAQAFFCEADFAGNVVTLSEVGAGSELGSPGQATLLILTDANGAATLRLTDGSATLVGSGGLRLTPVTMDTISGTTITPGAIQTGSMRVLAPIAFA